MRRRHAPDTSDTTARDSDLVERMRRGDRRAIRAFFRRYHPLLARSALRYGVQPALCDEIASDCLDSALLVLVRDSIQVPHSLDAYLVASLRNRIRNVRRGERRDEVHRRAAVREGVPPSEWIVTESSSEHSLKASEGPEHEPPPLAPVLERLANALDRTLSDEERRILAWVGDHVAKSVIATWLGISASTVRSRVRRLRERLRAVAVRYASERSTGEQRELNEFFRRTSAPAPRKERTLTMKPPRQRRRVIDEIEGD